FRSQRGRPTRPQIAVEARRHHEQDRRIAPIDERAAFGRRGRGRNHVEVGRAVEGGDDLPTRLRLVAVFDGQAHVPDVEVERVAVQEQEERRYDDENHERPPVPADLPQLLHRDRDDAVHGPILPAVWSTTSRKTSSSDGATGTTLVTSSPDVSSAARTASGCTSGLRSTA